MKQLSAMAYTVLGPLHLLGQIFACLVSVDVEQLDNVILTAWEAFLDEWEKNTDRSDKNQFDCRLAFIQERGFTNEQDWALAELRDMATEIGRSFDNSSAHYARTLNELARCLFYERKYGEAAAVAAEALRCAVQAHATRTEDVAGISCQSMQLLSLVESDLGKFDSAEGALRQLIGFEAARWGWHDPAVLRDLGTLERWLTELGRIAEAAEIEGQISEILSLSDAWV